MYSKPCIGLYVKKNVHLKKNTTHIIKSHSTTLMAPTDYSWPLKNILVFACSLTVCPQLAQQCFKLKLSLF